MDTWWICRKFLYPIGREAILVSMLMFCLRNPIFRFQNDRKIGADWTSQSSFSLYPCSSNEGFEYIFLQIRLDFYLCSAKRGINLSRMKNRSAEKTLFFSAGLFGKLRMTVDRRGESNVQTCAGYPIGYWLVAFGGQKRGSMMSWKYPVSLTRAFYLCVGRNVPVVRK